MRTEERSNYSTYYTFRKIKLYHLLITAFILFLFIISYYNNYYHNDVNDNGYSSEIPFVDNSVQNMKCPHYKIALFIFSQMEQVDKRMLMREELFGITDNLIPCMKQDTTEIFYRFLANKSKKIDMSILHSYTAEKMEFNDIIEIDIQHSDDLHHYLLENAKSLQEKCTTFDHLVIIDTFTMINLEKIKNKISTSTLVTDTQKLVWGSFNSNRTENMAVIIGASAIQPILDNLKFKLNHTSILSSLYLYHKKYPNKKIPSDLIFINDPISIIEWPNTITSIECADCVVAIGHIYQDVEIKQIKNELNIPTTLPCNARSDLKMYSKETASKFRPNVAVVTSSFLYKDNCMLEAGFLSAKNKREYAEMHGYAFVSRSAEFAQQLYHDRKPVWGKIDAIEKLLPYYEWLIWLDMDAIFVNRSLTVERFLEMCEEKVGGKEEFEKINIIVARPINDKMINAGVFLIKNSAWTRDLLRRGIQPRYDFSYTGSLEQEAMRDAIRHPYWRKNVLNLEYDDHSLNTFPDRYVRGDFIVHYAPIGGCPAAPVLRGLSNVKVLEEFPNAEISIPF
ncbi:hypothetical protein RhiirA5_494999 [Rhizophagus irregularis]|uniref:Mnn10p n=2 Tax=Rhizophagus irregularis TaxID=588596 RepID=A0A2N0Q752_9GLOM|nr:hypothetical protein RhiirA5_494999 [Rhizophagus irregularis]